MSKRFSNEDAGTLPTPRAYLGVHRVAAICRSCDRIVDLDLAALIDAGLGDVPLICLPLRCVGCGHRGHTISVGSQPRGA